MTVAPGLWAFLALLAVAASVYLLLYSRRAIASPAKGPMTFVAHANELRARLVRLVVLFVLWSACFVALRFEPGRYRGVPYPAPVLDVYDNMAARVYLAIAEYTVPEGVQLIVSRPTEAVAAQLQVSLLLAFLLTLPALLYELWAFFAPGLTPRERRVVALALPVSLFLFVLGAGFGYVIILPLLLEVFYNFAAPLGAVQFLGAGTLVATVVTFAFLFGLAFQLPLVQVLLVRLRVVTPGLYVRYWRHVTIGVFIVSAVATDPTLVSQVIVGAILLGLFWSGVAVSFLVRPGADAAARAAPPSRSKAS